MQSILLLQFPVFRCDDYSVLSMAIYAQSVVISPNVVVGLAFVILTSIIANSSSIIVSAERDFDSDIVLLHRDYTPPAPPPPPPHPLSLSCDFDLGGIGSLDTTCYIVFNLNLSKNVYIGGRGNVVIAPNVAVSCSSFSGCEFAISVEGNFTLGQNSSIITGSFELAADNATFGNGSTVNTTSLAGPPPSQTSGTPEELDGAGGGHGGRGAACLKDKNKLPEDVWGGDTYSWSGLREPRSYGSKGGTTSKEVDYGGGGGGRVKLVVSRLLELSGSVLADGGDGSARGGGGSGGSIYIKANKM